MTPSGFLACIPYQCNVYSVAMLDSLSDPISPGMCIAKTPESNTKLDHDYHCKELDREGFFERPGNPCNGQVYELQSTWVAKEFRYNLAIK